MSNLLKVANFEKEALSKALRALDKGIYRPALNTIAQPGNRVARADWDAYRQTVPLMYPKALGTMGALGATAYGAPKISDSVKDTYNQFGDWFKNKDFTPDWMKAVGKNKFGIGGAIAPGLLWALSGGKIKPKLTSWAPLSIATGGGIYGGMALDDWNREDAAHLKADGQSNMEKLLDRHNVDLRYGTSPTTESGQFGLPDSSDYYNKPFGRITPNPTGSITVDDI
jgi:hypothetical protein